MRIPIKKAPKNSGLSCQTLKGNEVSISRPRRHSSAAARKTDWPVSIQTKWAWYLLLQLVIMRDMSERSPTEGAVWTPRMQTRQRCSSIFCFRPWFLSQRSLAFKRPLLIWLVNAPCRWHWGKGERVENSYSDLVWMTQMLFKRVSTSKDFPNP